MGVPIISPVPCKRGVEYPGAMDPVMSRGDRHEDIFVDDADRQDFLKKLHLWMKANAEPAAAHHHTGEGTCPRNVNGRESEKCIHGFGAKTIQTRG